MKKIICTILITISFTANLFGQTEDIKNKAKLLFKKSDYKKALEILKQAEKERTDDPEVYYLLGFYSHYLAYDSRPLVGYGKKYSDKVISYLEKAIELNPNYGNAYYFLMAEQERYIYLRMRILKRLHQITNQHLKRAVSHFGC